MTVKKGEQKSENNICKMIEIVEMFFLFFCVFFCESFRLGKNWEYPNVPSSYSISQPPKKSSEPSNLGGVMGLNKAPNKNPQVALVLESSARRSILGMLTKLVGADRIPGSSWMLIKSLILFIV